MTSTQALNTQLVDGLVQTLMALTAEERQLLFQRLEEEKTGHEIRNQLQQYEQHYGLSSKDFYTQFISGSLGDAEDYIEWAGCYEMLQPIEDTDQ